MSKRTPGKKRQRQDKYYTPERPVAVLSHHLTRRVRFAEPCAGQGDLIRHLGVWGDHHCVYAGDISPDLPQIAARDALTLTEEDLAGVDFIITNPPWSRPVLHAMIGHLARLRPTWLLFDADWAHTRQAVPYLPYCLKIVSVGRVQWIFPGSTGAGLDNSAWYLFDMSAGEGIGPTFIGNRGMTP